MKRRKRRIGRVTFTLEAEPHAVELSIAAWGRWGFSLLCMSRGWRCG